VISKTSILYISNSRFPTEKAHGVQIAKMCEGFIEASFDLTLVIPKRIAKIIETPKSYYGLRVEIPIIKLCAVDFSVWPEFLRTSFAGQFLFYLQAVTFYVSTFFMTLRRPESIIFTRDHYSPLFCFAKSRVIWEVHELPTNLISQRLVIWLAAKCKCVICVNKAVENFFKANEVSKNSIYLPNAVDPSLFRTPMFKSWAKKTVCYTGSVYLRKGVYLLIDAGKYLDAKTEITIYGGPKAELVKLKNYAANLKLTNINVFPTVSYASIPKILCESDVLVLPNRGDDIQSSEQTSPLKLAEYLASHRPVVVADVPSLSEVAAQNEGVFLFEANNSKALASAIKLALVYETKNPKRTFLTIKDRVKKIYSIMR